MIWPWDEPAEGRDDDALPRWRHWLIALAALLLMRTFVPLFAAFV